jgi:hypothetical protein
VRQGRSKQGHGTAEGTGRRELGVLSGPAGGLGTAILHRVALMMTLALFGCAQLHQPPRAPSSAPVVPEPTTPVPQPERGGISPGAGQPRQPSTPLSPVFKVPQRDERLQVVPGPHGAFNADTRQFYPATPAGLFNPSTGQIYPRAGNGYINPATGQYLPAPADSSALPR